MDAVSREIIGVYIGARDEAGAQGLWDCLPPISASVQSLTPI